ncbi:MAG TPA: MGMT family protein [Verrucomicrobiae bacterium]|jgi:methylated-DNA-protein-cysteine methyltransferase-like protein|nr:MGMT family protein [Verrucomicrobiae bacterium]
MERPALLPRIRATILKIPRGKVSSYGAVAEAAGLPRGARQVVWALNQSQGLPWHRVVAAGGRIALPGELGFEQRFLLESEGVLFSGRRVRMKECECQFGKKTKTKPAKKLKRQSSKRRRKN